MIRVLVTAPKLPCPGRGRLAFSAREGGAHRIDARHGVTVNDDEQRPRSDRIAARRTTHDPGFWGQPGILGTVTEF